MLKFPLILSQYSENYVNANNVRYNYGLLPTIVQTALTLPFMTIISKAVYHEDDKAGIMCDLVALSLV